MGGIYANCLAKAATELERLNAEFFWLLCACSSCSFALMRIQIALA
jgi:hypothetical protein